MVIYGKDTENTIYFQYYHFYMCHKTSYDNQCCARHVFTFSHKTRKVFDSSVSANTKPCINIYEFSCNLCMVLKFFLECPFLQMDYVALVFRLKGQCKILGGDGDGNRWRKICILCYKLLRCTICFTVENGFHSI